MKRLLLLFTAALFVIGMRAAITPTSTQMWWGYYSPSEEISFLGTGEAETFDCAIFIPAGHELVGGSTIKAVRFYHSKSSNVSSAKVWISKSLPTTIANADYVQDITTRTLVNGANDIQLYTPYPVNNEGVYVGYTFTIKRAEYCIPAGGVYADNSLFLRSSLSVPSWGPVTGFGKLAMQLLLDGGNYPNNLATPQDFANAVVGLGQTVDVPVKVTNGGKDDITSLSYTVTTGGVTSQERTVTVPAFGYGATAEVSFTFDAAATEGASAAQLTITKVNGQPNTSADNVAQGTIVTVAELKTWARNVLIEEFTTERCVYCPDAASTLHTFLTTYTDLSQRVAVACHHDGFYTDWLTVPASTSYTWFYNDGGATYAPAFMYDRFAWDGVTPVEGRPASATGFKDRVEQRIAVPAYANINLTADFNAALNALNVTAYCEQGWEFTSKPVHLTLFLTEDNITAHSQTGANGTFVHQHVLRAVNSIWGEKLDMKDNLAEYSYTFNLDPSWKLSDLKVIAFMAPYDSSDPTKCVVENVAVTAPAFSSAITATDDGTATVTESYTLDGRRASTLAKGLNIVKMSDGTAKKVIKR